MRAVLAVTGAELLRFLRDRSNIFFVFIFPLLLVLVLGSQFAEGGSEGRVALAGEPSALQEAITTQLESQDVTVTTGSEDDVLQQVSRGRTGAALVLPEGSSAAYEAGQPVSLQIVPSSGADGLTTQQQVSSAVETLQLGRAQVAALTERGLDAGEAETALQGAEDRLTLPTVRVEDVDAIAQEFSGLGQFDLGATSQLLLFVFLISLAGSGSLIEARREGVIARSLAAPVSTGQVLLGQAGGRFTIALFQGAYIMLATALLFGVDWGNPLLAALVLIMFSAVAAGAAMVLGSVMDNVAAASGVGVGFGLVLAGMGGGMVPLEIFSGTLQQVAHLTPHAWAYDAFADIQRHEAGLVEILPELAVLAAMAAAALVVGTLALRRSVARSL